LEKTRPNGPASQPRARSRLPPFHNEPLSDAKIPTLMLVNVWPTFTCGKLFIERKSFRQRFF
jgi:hypothetical protein